MTFEALNDNVMLIELSREEMEKLHITYESLNDGNENMQTALKTLLSGINAQKRISKGEKVIVEALPAENGGCFFILTFTYNKKKRYKVKQYERSFIFRAENINDFLDFISTAKKNVVSPNVCQAYKLKNNYYLFIPEDSRILSYLVTEYGEKAENICQEWLKEHGESLGKVYLQ